MFLKMGVRWLEEFEFGVGVNVFAEAQAEGAGQGLVAAEADELYREAERDGGFAVLPELTQGAHFAVAVGGERRVRPSAASLRESPGSR